MYEYPNTAQALGINTLRKYRDRLFTKEDGKEYYYSDIDRLSNKLAHGLKGLGYCNKDRLAIILPNGVNYAVSYFGALKSGITLVPFNIMQSEKYISLTMKDAEVKVAITDIENKEKIEAIKQNMPTLKHIIMMGGDSDDKYLSWNNYIDKQPENEIVPDVHPDDEVFIAFSGGTTGQPKGIIHTQAGLFYDLFAHCVEIPMQFDERMLLATPFSHAAGILLMAGSMKGATFIIEKSFNPVRILELIEQEKITFILAVPTIIYMFLEILKQTEYDLKSLRIVLYGGGPIAEARLSEAIQRFGNVFSQQYGQAESPTMLCTLTIEDHMKAAKHPHILQSCGRPDLMVFLKIVDDNGDELPTGQVGEIIVKTPYIMKGYLSQPGLTAATIINGWLHTGDMGRVDEEGYVYIVDRKKDMIITGGMNVFPAEVEEVLRQHPKVKEVCVIGIPDEKWGEAVTACIVPAGQATEEDIKLFCIGRLSKYAQPKNIIFKEQLPHTLIGKIDKKALREPYWEGRTRGI